MSFYWYCMIFEKLQLFSYFHRSPPLSLRGNTISNFKNIISPNSLPIISRKRNRRSTCVWEGNYVIPLAQFLLSWDTIIYLFHDWFLSSQWTSIAIFSYMQHPINTECPSTSTFLQLENRLDRQRTDKERSMQTLPCKKLPRFTTKDFVDTSQEIKVASLRSQWLLNLHKTQGKHCRSMQFPKQHS